jgi:beta-galactosidase GanA
MSDVRNTHAAKYTRAPYGSLEEWAGIYCKYEIPADPRDFKMRWEDGRETNGSVWYDGLELRGAEALATYTEGPFAGLAAVTRKNMGKGQIIVLGTMPQPSDFQSLLLSICKETGVLPVAKASENVLVVPRTGEGQDGMIVMEIEHKPGHIVLPNKMMDILTGKEHTGMLELEPYTVMVLKKY